MRRLLLLLPLLAALLPVPVLAEPVDLNAVAADLGRSGDALAAAYDPADGEATAERFYDLYFDVFEGRGLEAEIGADNPALKIELEAQFSFIIDLLYRGAPRTELAQHWGMLRDRIADTARTLSDRHSRSLWAVFVQAALIMLREGAEAAVLIAAMISAAHRRKSARTEPAIWCGAAAAAAAAIVTASLLPLGNGGAAMTRETLEGSALLLAALMSALAAHWLWFGDAPDRLAHMTERSLAGLSGMASSALLGFLAFLAVYREGAEIILFNQILAAGAMGGHAAAAAGTAVGSLCLGAACLGWRAASPRLPPTAFLALTAVPLFTLAVVFVGRGIFTLQNVGIVPATLLSWGPTVSWLGVFPSLEGLAAQAAMLSLLPLATAGLRRGPAVRGVRRP